MMLAAGIINALQSQSFQLRAQLVTQPGPRQGIGDVGGEEADLHAGVEDAALEHGAVEFLGPRKGEHGIGELDLAAGAALLGFQKLKNLGLEDVSPRHSEVRRRRALFRLLDHLSYLKGVVADGYT